MSKEANLNRYLDAQRNDYETAFREIKDGRKRSHWMWYIFPQIAGLGFSSTSNFYGIKDIEEALAYINHPVLSQRLLAISELLLTLPADNATSIFGSPDDVKLKSCMTLFASLPDSQPVFQQVLDKYFSGNKDEKTTALLKAY